MTGYKPVPQASVITPYAYQRRMAANPARFAMYEWSRQVGKSLGVALLVNLDILQVEAAGKRTLWTVISRSLAQARELARKIRDVGRAVMAARKILRGIDEGETRDALGETQLELTYPGGSRVIVVSGNPDAAAGYTGNVVWDEVGLTKRAHELFGTAFPVVSRGGYRFLMTSTPRPGFWNQRFEDARKPGSAWYAETLDIFGAVADGCPQNPDELRAALKDDLRWRQEFLCEHVDDDVCWLPWEMLVNATDARATVAVAPHPDATDTYAGWDVARWQHLSVRGSRRGRRADAHSRRCRPERERAWSSGFVRILSLRASRVSTCPRSRAPRSTTVTPARRPSRTSRPRSNRRTSRRRPPTPSCTAFRTSPSCAGLRTPKSWSSARQSSATRGWRLRTAIRWRASCGRTSPPKSTSCT